MPDQPDNPEIEAAPDPANGSQTPEAHADSPAQHAEPQSIQYGDPVYWDFEHNCWLPAPPWWYGPTPPASKNADDPAGRGDFLNSVLTLLAVALVFCMGVAFGACFFPGGLAP